MPSKSVTTIDFHGAKLIARCGETPETTMVAMKPVVEGMGLDWKGQHAKLCAHPILSKGMENIPIPSAGGVQEMTAIPLNRLNFWLATIQPSRVPDAARAKVIEYQTECADVLFAHFFGTALASTGADLPEDNYRRIGGVAKAVIGKALAPIEARLAQLDDKIARLAIEADPRVAAVEFKPMLQVLVELKVPSKGRRIVCQRASNRLRRWTVEADRQGAVRISRETGKYLFHVDAINNWLAAEGRALIARHAAAISGQAALDLRTSRARSCSNVEAPR